MLLSIPCALVVYMCIVIHKLAIHVVLLIEVLLVVSRWGSTGLVPCIIHDLLQSINALRAWLHQLLCCLAAILQIQLTNHKTNKPTTCFMNSSAPMILGSMNLLQRISCTRGIHHDVHSTCLFWCQGRAFLLIECKQHLLGGWDLAERYSANSHHQTQAHTCLVRQVQMNLETRIM